MKKIKTIWKNKKREITLILIISMVLALFFCGYSIAKEFAAIDIEVNTNIMEPILIVEHSPIVKIEGNSEVEYYNFKVKNYNEEEITPISLRYNIEILWKKEETISLELYKNNQEILLKDNKTDKIELSKEIKQEDLYQLKINYDKTKNSSIEDIIQEISIKICAEQINGEMY